MSQSFSSREPEIRFLGKYLEAEVAKGDTLPTDTFDKLLRLPRVETRLLKDTILSLCEARLGGGDSERITRLQNCGAATIRYFGLGFDEATINDEFVPRLLSMAESASSRQDGVRSSRYERLLAIAQLAPRIYEENLDEVFQGALELARFDGEFEPGLLLPLGNFERVYRTVGGANSRSSATRCQNLCLKAIQIILESSIQDLAEANESTLSEVLSMLPTIYITGMSLLTILPSVTRRNDPACVKRMGEILDHCEWLLSRGEGFPGNYLNCDEIESFDNVRSILSLSAAMLSIHCADYQDVVQTMRIAKRKGSHRLGTITLELARSGNGAKGVASVQDLVLHELQAYTAPGAMPIDQESMREVAALAWHLDVKDSPFLTKALECVRDPRGQFFLAKALEGSPWE